MSAFISALFLIIGFVLQSTLLSQFTIGGIAPNLLVIIVATVGFIHGNKFGMITGFAAGLLMDIFFGNVIGLYALIFMYIGYIDGLFKKILYEGDFKLPFGLIIASDIVYGHICYFCFFLIKGDFRYFYYLKSVILPEVVYTSVVACVLFPFMKLIFGLIHRYFIEEEESIG